MKRKTLPMVYCEYSQTELELSQLLEEAFLLYLAQIYEQKF